MDVAAAYRQCEEITWSQARNFSYGIRLLPPDKRRALAAVYAFARRIDDIGDGTPPPAESSARSARPGRASWRWPTGATQPASVRKRVAPQTWCWWPSLTRAGASPPAGGFRRADRRVRGRRAGHHLHDLRGPARYCCCVAGSIGRLSLGVSRTRDLATAPPLADSLGVALQLTNILRDILEDHQDGRIYLPEEDLNRFRVDPPPDLASGRSPTRRPWTSRPSRPTGPAMVRARAAAVGMLDRRSAACSGAMAGIYHRLLQSIAAAPQLVLQRRVSLSPGQKAMVAVRSLAGAALRSGRNGPPRSTTTAGSP